jgi:lauroyl/myristoyl acyltransferase
MTAPALAVLALRFDCDVLPARVERLDGARFRLTVFPPLPLPRSGDHHADAAALMARVNATFGGVGPRPTGAMIPNRPIRSAELGVAAPSAPPSGSSM